MQFREGSCIDTSNRLIYNPTLNRLDANHIGCRKQRSCVVDEAKAKLAESCVEASIEEVAEMIANSEHSASVPDPMVLAAFLKR